MKLVRSLALPIISVLLLVGCRPASSERPTMPPTSPPTEASAVDTPKLTPIPTVEPTATTLPTSDWTTLGDGTVLYAHMDMATLLNPLNMRRLREALTKKGDSTKLFKDIMVRAYVAGITDPNDPFVMKALDNQTTVLAASCDDAARDYIRGIASLLYGRDPALFQSNRVTYASSCGWDAHTPALLHTTADNVPRIGSGTLPAAGFILFADRSFNPDYTPALLVKSDALGLVKFDLTDPSCWDKYNHLRDTPECTSGTPVYQELAKTMQEAAAREARDPKDPAVFQLVNSAALLIGDHSEVFAKEYVRGLVSIIYKKLGCPSQSDWSYFGNFYRMPQDN